MSTHDLLTAPPTTDEVVDRAARDLLTAGRLSSDLAARSPRWTIPSEWRPRSWSREVALNLVAAVAAPLVLGLMSIVSLVMLRRARPTTTA